MIKVLDPWTNMQLKAEFFLLPLNILSLFSNNKTNIYDGFHFFLPTKIQSIKIELNFFKM